MHSIKTASLTLFVTLGFALPAVSQPAPTAPAAPESTKREVQRVASFQGLAGLLNLARGCVRIVAVVSPAAPGADADLDSVLSVMRTSSSKRLRAYVVITTTAADADAPAHAASFAGRHSKDRVVCLWDPGAVVANAWKSSMGVESEDIGSAYYLYDTATIFAGAPPKPDTWMRDRRDVPEARFDARVFRDRASELVRRVESKVAGTEPRTP